MGSGNFMLNEYVQLFDYVSSVNESNNAGRNATPVASGSCTGQCSHTFFAEESNEGIAFDSPFAPAAAREPQLAVQEDLERQMKKRRIDGAYRSRLKEKRENLEHDFNKLKEENESLKNLVASYQEQLEKTNKLVRSKEVTINTLHSENRHLTEKLIMQVKHVDTLCLLVEILRSSARNSTAQGDQSSNERNGLDILKFLASVFGSDNQPVLGIAEVPSAPY